MANETPQTQVQPRGAGTGEKANIKRRFSDPVAVVKSHAEHVEELEAIAEENAEFNNEMNQIQTEINNKVQPLLDNPRGEPLEAAEMRAAARESFLLTNDPEKKAAAVKGQMAARAKAAKAQTAAK